MGGVLNEILCMKHLAHKHTQEMAGEIFIHLKYVQPFSSPPPGLDSTISHLSYYTSLLMEK